MRIAATARRRVVAARDDDRGFALMFVLFVAVMVMIGTATMLTVTSSNIRPAKQSQDTYAALAAAQSGIQDWVATLNRYCRTDSIQTCAYLQTAANRTLTATLPDDQSYTATVLNPTTYITGNSGAVRVRSTGTAGGGTNGVTRQLVADVSGVPSVLRFTYFSNYETLGKSFLDSYYGARTIPLARDAASAVDLTTGTTVTWKGTSVAPTNTYTDDVCDSLFYDDPSNPVALANKGRAAVALNRPGLPAGSDFSEDGYTRSPAQQLLALALPNAKTAVTRNVPCEVTFTKGMTFTGPVYSRDAMSLSNGSYGSTTGPSFTIPAGETSLPAVSTGWLASSVPAADPAAPYRTSAQLGGTPTTASTSTAQLIRSSQQRFTLPSSASPDATCTYTGPTRITVRADGTAEVTSPLTPARPGGCYQSTAAGSGVVKASVAIGATTLQIDDAAATAATSTPSFPDLSLGAGNDITTYSPTRGDAYVEGTLGSGRLSIVAANDIVVTNDLKTTSVTGTNANGETSWTSGAAIDLVATNNVRLYHPVACATGSPNGGYCPNDITGLYTTAQSGAVVTEDGTLRSVHPSLQYCPIVSGTKDCSVGDRSDTREIDAAVIALNGSLLTDNFNRGRALGDALVKGGVYANHRGATGQQWEIPALTSTRHNSGYKLQVSYVSYEFAGLPYVPVLEAGQSVRPWFVLNISTGG